MAAVVVLAVGTAGARADFAFSWLTQFGTASDDRGQSIVVDSNGQSWVAGFTDGGSFDVSNAGASDMILSRLSSTGTVDFTHQRGGTGSDQALSVAFAGSGTVFTGGTSNAIAGSGLDQINGLSIGPDDSVYLTGFTGSDLSGPSAGGNDIFVAKIDAIPEPSIWTMLVAGSAGFLAFRQNRRICNHLNS